MRGNAAAIRWVAGDGTRAYHDPIRVPHAPPEGLRPKGSVNLRLFFRSERYSEVMDFDADQRLNAKMRRVLDEIVNEGGFRRELLNLGIDDVIAPDQAAKHTATTLRYKLQVVTILAPHVRARHESRWEDCDCACMTC